jgi:hypothetical protein
MKEIQIVKNVTFLKKMTESTLEKGLNFTQKIK